MNESKQKVTSALIRQMTKRIEEMDDDDLIDDEIRNLCQMDMFDVKVKEEIEKMETIKNMNLDQIEEEVEEGVEMSRLGMMANKIGHMTTVKEMKD